MIASLLVDVDWLMLLVFVESIGMDAVPGVQAVF